MRSVPSLRNLIPEENNMNKTLRSLLLSAMVAALPAAAVMANETPTLRIATEGAYPPFNYFTADGVIPPFLALIISRGQATKANFCLGVMPPRAIFGRS